MKNILARGGVEFLAVFLGIGLSFNVEEWREESQIRERLKADYQSIQNDLEKEIPYLIQIIEGQKESIEAGLKLIQMLDEEHSFDYKLFVESKKLVTSGNTFFGTKASYEASVSSGRLTYFGIDTLANEMILLTNGDTLSYWGYSPVKDVSSIKHDIETNVFEILKSIDSIIPTRIFPEEYDVFKYGYK